MAASHLGRAVMAAWRTGPAATGLFMLSVASNLLLLTGPLFMLQIYDRVLASRSVPTLLALTGLMVGLYVFYGVVEVVRGRMAIRYSSLVAASYAEPVFSSVIAAGAAPDQKNGHDPVRDLETVRQYLSGNGPLAFFDLPWVPVFMLIVFAFHPMLGWLSVGGATVAAGLMLLTNWFGRKPGALSDAAAGARSLQHADVRQSAETVVAMGMEAPLTRRWATASNDLIRAQARAADSNTIFSSATKAFRLLLQSSVLAMGAFLALNGELTPGLMIAASIMTARALSPVEQVISNWRGFIAARKAMSRIRQALDEMPAAEGKATLPAPRTSFSVNELAIAPMREGPPLLAGLNFSLQAGEAVGILGISGCGKSSLIRTLTGVWPARSGTVRLDGSEPRHFDPDVLGRAIGYLPQTVELFDGTVAENIARFRTDVDFNQVIAAARAANIHEMVAGLPDGYQTQIGARGVMLSAGQRQRIGLARALFGDPFLIVLDEPNSNLDAAGDTAFNAAVEAAKARGAIVIIVAHRPAAIAAVDKILFLQDGRQAAFGPKDTVLAAITAQPASLEAARKARAQ